MCMRACVCACVCVCVCVPGMWGPEGGGGKPGQEEGQPGSLFFSLMSEVAGGEA